jgi:hypothetical protein
MKNIKRNVTKKGKEWSKSIKERGKSRGRELPKFKQRMTSVKSQIRKLVEIMEMPKN